MIDVRELVVGDAAGVVTGAVTVPEPGRIRRSRPAWPDEEAKALAGLRDRLFGRLEPPRRLHRYVLLERLGSGGGGIVYAAYDPQLDRKVAIKLLRGLADERAQLRLVREAQALAKLAHPNVVAVFDVGTYDAGRPDADPRALPGVPAGDPIVFIVMEYVDGPTLADWLRTPRSERAVLDQFVAAGRGLVAAHALGIVHRDFKPHNVVIGGDGRPRVLDFGLSRLLARSEPAAEPTTTSSEMSIDVRHSLTDDGTVMGTPAYMAPEQHLGAAVDARADQYAFCVALFEALHGHRPFVAANLGELVLAKREGAVRPTARRLPRRIEQALARGLAAQPDARHADLAALIAELEPRGRRAWSWLAGAVVVLATLLAWVLATRHPSLSTCEPARNEFASSWTEGRRAEVTAAFLRSGERLADANLVDVLAGIDRWGDAWTSSRTQTCIAASTASADAEILRRRSVCLDHALGAAQKTIELLANADPRTVAWSREVMQSMPDVARCDNDEALAREAIPPDDDAVEAVGRVMSDLVALRTRVLTGEERRAVAIGRGAVDTADRSGHPPSRVRSHYALAWALSRTGALAEAEEHLRAGWLLAESQRLDDLQIRGALDLSGVLRARGRAREADAMLDAAIAKASRNPSPPGVASDFAVQRGRSRLDAGRIDLAIAELEDALATREEVFGPDHAVIAWTALDLARAHAVAGHVDEVRRHLRRASDVLEHHPPTGLVNAELLDVRAELSALEGQPAAAIAAWATLDVLAASRSVGDPLIRARATNGLAASWLVLDRVDAAQAVIVEAPERCQATVGALHGLCIDAFDLRSRVALARHDDDAALADARAAVTLADAALDDEHPRRAALHEALAQTTEIAARR